jgi:hypothetical protein
MCKKDKIQYKEPKFKEIKLGQYNEHQDTELPIIEQKEKKDQIKETPITYEEPEINKPRKIIYNKNKMGTRNPDIVTSITFDNKGIWIKLDRALGGWATGWKWKEGSETSEDTLIEQIRTNFNTVPKEGQYRFIKHTLTNETGVDFYLTKIRVKKDNPSFKRITFGEFERLLQGKTYERQKMSDGYMEAKKEILKELAKELLLSPLEINTITQSQNETIDSQIELEWKLEQEYKLYIQQQIVEQKKKAQINRIEKEEKE